MIRTTTLVVETFIFTGGKREFCHSLSHMAEVVEEDLCDIGLTSGPERTRPLVASLVHSEGVGEKP